MAVPEAVRLHDGAWLSTGEIACREIAKWLVLVPIQIINIDRVCQPLVIARVVNIIGGSGVIPTGIEAGRDHLVHAT